MAALIGKLLLTPEKKNALLRFASYQRSHSVLKILSEKQLCSKKTIQGWVRSLRKMKSVIFVDVNDGSCTENIQIVIPKVIRPENLSQGSSISVSGVLRETPQGQLEIEAEVCNVIGGNDPVRFPLPTKQQPTHDYCRQYLHLRPKLPHFQALLRVRHRVLQTMHNWFDRHEFVGIHTSMLTGNDCEGAGEIFQVLPVSECLVQEMKKKGQKDAEAFFGNPAYLSVSGQLHLEAITRGFSKCYAISPTFRAENSKSRLHLSEFYMVEAEEAFVSDLAQLLRTMEDLVKDTVRTTVSDCSQDLRVIYKYDSMDPDACLKKLEEFSKKDFIRLPFSEACRIVKEKKDPSADCEREGLSKEHELFLVDYLDQTPVFVVDWPTHMKPFYMKACTGNDQLVSAVDLLVPNVGELCGGSLREDDIEQLERKLIQHKIVDSMKWYLDLRRYGNVPTAGFGLGFERFLQLVTGLTNIKDTIPFPRWPHCLKM